MRSSFTKGRSARNATLMSGTIASTSSIPANRRVSLDIRSIVMCREPVVGIGSRSSALGIGSWDWVLGLGLGIGSWDWVLGLGLGIGSWDWVLGLGLGIGPWVLGLGCWLLGVGPWRWPSASAAESCTRALSFSLK